MTKQISKVVRKKRAGSMPKTLSNLYEVADYLHLETLKDLNVFIQDLFIQIQDPLVAKKIPEMGVNPIYILWEPGLSDGPTSARLAVVDFDIDTGRLQFPARWNEEKRRFESPKGQKLSVSLEALPQFHQVNAWATVQSILKLFESPDVFGRCIPWGVDGNRLIIVPHAGFTPNAFYNRAGKSLQFYYYGDPDKPTYTCLSHDIVAHETGHALLDGIRPFYLDFSSLETAAFHEFFADITAMLACLRNNVVRRYVANDTKGNLAIENVISSLAEQFGEEVYHTKELRNLASERKMDFIQPDSIPHDCSLILTGAIFDILKGIVDQYKGSPLQKLWWGTTRILHMTFQPIDFLPPVDVNFLDYARALLRYFELFEPFNSERRVNYETIVKETFSNRGFELKDLEAASFIEEWDFHHSINELSRSRTNAYRFLHENRKKLHIPAKQDFRVLDIYDTYKYGHGATHLPRQIIIQYLWREEVPLQEDRFGPLKGKTAELLCGGTLAFDESGNLLSWMYKPGCEFPSTRDRKEGERRKTVLLNHIAAQVQAGRVGLQDSEEAKIPGPWMPGVVACTREGLVHLEIATQLSKTLNESENGSLPSFSFITRLIR